MWSNFSPSERTFTARGLDAALDRDALRSSSLHHSCSHPSQIPIRVEPRRLRPRTAALRVRAPAPRFASRRRDLTPAQRRRDLASEQISRWPRCRSNTAPPASLPLPLHLASSPHRHHLESTPPRNASSRNAKTPSAGDPARALKGAAVTGALHPRPPIGGSAVRRRPAPVPGAVCRSRCRTAHHHLEDPPEQPCCTSKSAYVSRYRSIFNLCA
jgi:hypothetical protein